MKDMDLDGIVKRVDELKDEVTNEVKLVYELKRDIANDMVSKRYKCSIKQKYLQIKKKK